VISPSLHTYSFWTRRAVCGTAVETKLRLVASLTRLFLGHEDSKWRFNIKVRTATIQSTTTVLSALLTPYFILTPFFYYTNMTVLSSNTPHVIAAKPLRWMFSQAPLTNLQSQRESAIL
jgi:hypothetical protein